MHLRHLRALDLCERLLAQDRQDVFVHRRFDRLQGIRLATHCGVFLEIPPGEIGHRWPAGGIQLLQHRGARQTGASEKSVSR